MGALSDRRVGELLAQHFVAAYEQVGGFEAVTVNGDVRKNGGNVASYFCTPDGRVVHAVTGPVRADVLLAEARWALESYRESGSDPWERAEALKVRHREAADGRARSNNQQRQVHQLLARRPLPLIADVEREVFGQILGERVRDDESFLGLAKAAFEAAEENGQPVLLILHRDSDNRNAREGWYNVLSQAARDRRGWGQGARDPRSLEERRRAEAVLGLARKYVVLGLPINELPALSQHLGIEPYAAPSRSATLLVVARSDGRQVHALSGWPARHDLTRALARGLIAQAQDTPPAPADLRELRRLVELIDDALALQVRELFERAAARPRGRS